MYRKFWESGTIDFINEDIIKKVVDNIKGRHAMEKKAFLITLYYTGARPNEVLKLRTSDIRRDKSYIVVSCPASKGGNPRPIYLRFSKSLVKLFYKYALSLPPSMYLFFNLQSRYVRDYIDKSGNRRTYIETTDKLRYHFKEWFKPFMEDPIPPYFFRHNRFSKMINNGASIEEIMFIKGSKTLASVMPYAHMSTATAKKLAKKID